jgi:hypothetical protein
VIAPVRTGSNNNRSRAGIATAHTNISLNLIAY